MFNKKRFTLRKNEESIPGVILLTYTGAINVGDGIKKIVSIPVEIMTAKEFNKRYSAQISSQRVLNVRGFVIALPSGRGSYRVYCGQNDFANFNDIDDAMSSIYQSGIEFAESRRASAKIGKTTSAFIRGNFVEPGEQYNGGLECGMSSGLVLSSSGPVVSVFWLDTFKICPYHSSELKGVTTKDVIENDLKHLTRYEIELIESKTKLKLPC